MSANLKPCPSCGRIFSESTWNNRPIEDALRAENVDLRHELYEQKLRLESELRGAREHIQQLREVAKQAKIAMKAQGYKFIQAIGNLEEALRKAGEK